MTYAHPLPNGGTLTTKIDTASEASIKAGLAEVARVAALVAPVSQVDAVVGEQAVAILERLRDLLGVASIGAVEAEVERTLDARVPALHHVEFRVEVPGLEIALSRIDVHLDRLPFEAGLRLHLDRGNDGGGGGCGLLGHDLLPLLRGGFAGRGFGRGDVLRGLADRFEDPAVGAAAA